MPEKTITARLLAFAFALHTVASPHTASSQVFSGETFNSTQCDELESKDSLSRIHIETDEQRRWKQFHYVTICVAITGPDTIKENAIPIIVKMLSDHNDGVRSEAALILSTLGRRGKSAIPSLRSALSERPCSLSLQPSSVDAIRAALQKLGDHPPRTEEVCSKAEKSR